MNARLQCLFRSVSMNLAGHRPQVEHPPEPLLENDQRFVLRLLLNYRQSHQVPVDTEIRLPVLACSCKMHLRQFSAEDGIAADRELLFEYAQFFESLRELKGNSVPV